MVHEERFATGLFHHTSQECSIGLRKIYNISLAQFVLSGAMCVIFLQVKVPLMYVLDKGHEHRALPVSP